MATQPEVLLDRAQIDHVVDRLAAEISERYRNGVVLVGVLRGSVPFLSDLVRRMTITPLIDFVAITSYQPDTGGVRLLKDLDLDIAGRDVVIVEDIVDTGQTTAFLHGEFARRQPRSLAVCSLVDRAAHRIEAVTLDFVGVEIPDIFVVGYGLDHEGRYRNAPVLAVADLEVLRSDPDAYVEALYPT